MIPLLTIVIGQKKDPQVEDLPEEEVEVILLIMVMVMAMEMVMEKRVMKVVYQVIEDHQVPKDYKDPWVPKVFKDPKDFKETEVCKDLLVSQGIQGVHGIPGRKRTTEVLEAL